MSASGPVAVAAVATTETAIETFSATKKTREQIKRIRSSFSTHDSARPNLEQSSAQHLDEEPKTYFYLAYGSNLCAETFRRKRKINPLSSINVVVPELEVVFDLPGLPYSEPAFANSRFRTDPNDSEKGKLLEGSTTDFDDFTTSALGWNKGLVGTVYEVTPEDFAHIIATEGGGAAYADITVECYPLAKGVETVPVNPAGESFKAHTLYAGNTQGKGMRRHGWAEPSERYLNLIKTGAAENELPTDYRNWLVTLKPYRATNWRQTAGKVFLIATWLPWILVMFQLQALLSDKKGRGPKWLQRYSERLFRLVWTSYDRIFYPIFGEGERTIGDEYEPPAYRRKGLA